jgi:hypothetical protein
MRRALVAAALLGALPAAAQAPAPAVGDTWTYRLTQPGPREGPAERRYVVTIGAVSRGDILDQVSIGGGASWGTRHAGEARLLSQAAGIFSPYLLALNRSPPGAALRSVEIADPACTGAYLCDASAQAASQETVTVPAGTFGATKIVIEQSWRPAFAGSGAGSGARVLTVWYAAEPRRAVKYSSRLSFGDSPPMEADFDLELVSYRFAPGPPRVIAAPKPLQSGDNWTYRIVAGGRPQRTLFVQVASLSPTLIIEHASVEGGFTRPWRHAKGGALIPQGVSVFSPYLPHFEQIVVGAELGYIENTDPGCRDQFVCTASGSIAGEETVSVGGRSLAATKVVIQQTWRPAAGVKGDAAELEQMRGSRTLTVWYAAEAKRAVKYESRRTSGARAPLETDFDVELTSYQVR